MKALILLSHGSRHPESNAEMQSLAAQIQSLADNAFSQVECAFQQFAEPSLEQVFDRIVEKGVDQIVVLPLFLAAGGHVLVDVPELIKQMRVKYPEVMVTLMPHLGQTAGLARFLFERAAGI